MRAAGGWVLALGLGALLSGCAGDGPPELWVALYDGPGSHVDGGLSIAVSASGDGVYVSGTSEVLAGVSDWVTLGLEAHDGKRRWASRLDGSVSGAEEGLVTTLSPDGSWLAVAGTSGNRAAVAAYDAVTGRERWSVRYAAFDEGGDAFRGLAVAPNGTRVYAGGTSQAADGAAYALVAAYEAGKGGLLWSLHDDTGGADTVRDLALDPSGRHVAVAGLRSVPGKGNDVLIALFDAHEGKRLWTVVRDGGAGRDDLARKVSFSPDGSRLLVAGTSRGADGAGDLLAAAFDVADGRLAWWKTYGDAGAAEEGHALALAPDGSLVFVAGQGGSRGLIAVFDEATGNVTWTARHGESGQASLQALAVAPGGKRLYAGGYTSGVGSGSETSALEGDLVTLAYDARSGEPAWTRLHPGPGFVLALGVAPDGSRVYAGGSVWSKETRTDVAVLAYDA